MIVRQATTQSLSERLAPDDDALRIAKLNALAPRVPRFLRCPAMDALPPYARWTVIRVANHTVNRTLWFVGGALLWFVAVFLAGSSAHTWGATPLSAPIVLEGLVFVLPVIYVRTWLVRKEITRLVKDLV
jgi:hypothetical protein